MSLLNYQILIVEDEYMLAQDLQLELENVGAIVIGPEATIDGALARIGQEKIDAAVLDVNLGGVSGFSIADVLINKNIPFIFASGYDDEAVTKRYPGINNCAKPFTTHHLMRALEQLIH